ncbi:hypothetical protein IFM89_036368 [Coptis chinensis]|uniref:FAS1 domain-containing protein n=1 Tax=Coptis chinensis TaxID=261450 RepID=A0A835LNQ4_9MAGN|nr:hypothetical protein IFM89_024232 [Coptis chinensis]KAF9599242.1 hypothetical protein IFM89_036368 [Coptis chinensis]
MEHSGGCRSVTRATSLLSICIILLLTFFPADTSAHNVTKILAKHPEFSTFNHYLTITHLADEINRRETITVCAVDNAGMSDLLSKHLSVFAIKNVLSLHILLDYFGAKKLHQITNGTALAATMFQATGAAPGSTGFVNVTDLKGGKVGFGAEDNGGTLDASYVKSVQEIPYNISVIQISKILPSPEAEAPTPAPSQLNLTALMTKKGCKVFADLLIATGALTTFEDNADGGLTVFCPLDSVINGFIPKYKNLTTEGKVSLLLYHGVPVYSSMAMLKSNNGLMNTLATDGVNKYDFTVQNDGAVVTLKTKLVTARLTGTLLDEQPLAIYTINKVLMPKELFKAALAPAPAPAPEADAPKAADSTPSAAEPIAPDGEPADQTADQNDASGLRSKVGAGLLVATLVSVWLGTFMSV